MVLQVAFLGRGLNVASTRYRIVIPAYELQKQGVEITKDAPILVFNKGSIDLEILKLYPKTVYDICDDNLDCPERGQEYRFHLARADAITCNSEAMRFIVHQKTKRIATVIPDPYEHPEWSPSWGEGVMWFGHWTNLKDFHGRGIEATIITNASEVLQGTMVSKVISQYKTLEWSTESMDAAYRSHALVVIPTGRAIAKSANRLIESVRAGKFVVAEPLPAYEEFGEWMWVGDLKEGLEWAKSHKSECLERVKACQDYIRGKYSPKRIGAMWLKVLGSI